MDNVDKVQDGYGIDKVIECANAALVERLAGIGVDEKEANVRNKVSSDKFTAAFLLQ